MKQPENRFWTGLRRNFAAGLLVLVPLLITLWIVEQLFKLLSGVLDAPVAWLFGSAEELGQPFPLLGWAGLKIGHLVPVLSVMALLTIIVVLGLIARNILGARLLAFGEDLLRRIPIVNRIYLAVRQISETLLSNQKGAFKRAVLFEYPRRGIWSVGFVTRESGGELACGRNEESLYHIFLPTTPNPTSGFMLVVPREDCVDLDMPVEDALKLIISGGAVSPDTLPTGSGEEC